MPPSRRHQTGHSRRRPCRHVAVAHPVQPHSTGCQGALPGARTGSSCGYACPAAGWPAPMTHRTKTPWPTTKRPTTPSPPRCDVVQGCVGATSITARSDSCEWLRLVACLAWDQVAGLLATHRGSPVRLRLTRDKPELLHQPADQLRADLPAGADERDVLAPEPVGAVGVVEQLWLRGGRWQLEVEERANSGAVPPEREAQQRSGDGQAGVGRSNGAGPAPDASAAGWSAG